MVELTCKQLGATWDISDTKTTQAFMPWYDKLVLLCRDYPTETVKILARAMEEADNSRTPAPYVTPARS